MKFFNLLIKLSIIGMIGIAYIIYSNTHHEPGFINDDTGNLISHLPYEVSGNQKSKVILIFLHGFPNTFRMWDHMIENLNKDFLCINISYPNYTEKLELKWGMDLLDIAFYIKHTVELIENEIRIKNKLENNIQFNRIIVSHDWGAVLSYLVDSSYNGFAKEIVALDVGSGIEESIKAKISTLSYQWYLATNFLIGNKVGDYLTNLFFNLIPKPIYGISEKEFEKINSKYNYFYYQFWKRIIYFSKFLKEYKTETPISFFYGKNKSFMFHNDRFINMLKTNKESDVHGVEGGHWFMEKKENMKLILDRIRKIAKKY